MCRFRVWAATSRAGIRCFRDVPWDEASVALRQRFPYFRIDDRGLGLWEPPHGGAHVCEGFACGGGVFDEVVGECDGTLFEERDDA